MGNWDGDKDLDSFKGEDWRGWVDGKYDNRYGGRTKSGGISVPGGGTHYGSGSYGGGYYSGRHDGSVKKWGLVAVLLFAGVIGLAYYDYTGGTLPAFPDFLSSPSSSEPFVNSDESMLTEFFDSKETQEIKKISNCILRSDKIDTVVVTCGNLGSATFISKNPIKTSIISDVELNNNHGQYSVSFIGTSGQKESYNLELQSNSNTSKIPEILDKIPIFPPDISTSLEEFTKKSNEQISKFNSEIQNINNVKQTPEEESQQALQYINKIRQQNGKEPISHDSRVYQLAIARAKDMYDYKYLDHTNPQTGTCPYNMKSNFGLKSNENVAENAHMTGSAGMPILYNPSLTGVVDGWMQSTGHRMNLLSYEHVSGSVACYGGYCVFLGLNHGHYGEGCYTASEGQAYASRFDNCTTEQMSQYEKLQQEYDKVPPVIHSESEYQRAMNLYKQIENFKC